MVKKLGSDVSEDANSISNKRIDVPASKGQRQAATSNSAFFWGKFMSRLEAERREKDVGGAVVVTKVSRIRNS